MTAHRDSHHNYPARIFDDQIATTAAERHRTLAAQRVPRTHDTCHRPDEGPDMNPYVVIQNLLNQLDLGSAGSSGPAAAYAARFSVA